MSFKINFSTNRFPHDMIDKNLIYDLQSSSNRRHQKHQVGAVSPHSFTPQNNNLFLNFFFPIYVKDSVKLRRKQVLNKKSAMRRVRIGDRSSSFFSSAVKHTCCLLRLKAVAMVFSLHCLLWIHLNLIVLVRNRLQYIRYIIWYEKFVERNLMSSHNFTKSLSFSLLNYTLKSAQPI
jgi:hypothetical protein